MSPMGHWGRRAGEEEGREGRGGGRGGGEGIIRIGYKERKWRGKRCMGRGEVEGGSKGKLCMCIFTQNTTHTYTANV